MTDTLMTATPELLDEYAARAGGAADALNRQALVLRDALQRFDATCDRATVSGPLPDPDQFRSLAARIHDLGREVAAVAAAVRTADTTAQVDLVIMRQSAFEPALRQATAPPTPAPTPVDPAVPHPTSIAGWRRLAYERAGVDTASWDPTVDMRANDARIQAIWERYGQFYLADPKHLWWAGMAKFAGSTVYAGMMDLKSIVDIAGAEERPRAIREWLSHATPGLADDALNRLASVLVDMTAEQLNGFLGLFQRMEKAIADDLLWQHEAYRTGGLPALLPFHLMGRIRTPVMNAWFDINSGDPSRVARGTRALVDQEQRKILPPYFDELRSTRAGEAFAEVLTLTTESPIPGGKAYRDVMVSDRQLGPIPLPDPRVPAHRRFLPGQLGRVRGNVADKDDRWEWIIRDMFPAYRRFLTDHREQMDVMMRTPVADLAHERRKSPVPYR
jgi:hypothetical protein